MSLIADERGCADRLAKFFPVLPAIRIMVRVQSLRLGRQKLQESTVLEFGSGQFAIFMTTLPLEFDESVQLVKSNEERPLRASVIALQYHEGLKAVAVRFTDATCDWMMQP
jgi:hypothetical protein